MKTMKLFGFAAIMLAITALPGCQALKDVGNFVKEEVTHPPQALILAGHAAMDFLLGILQTAFGIVVHAVFPF